MNGLELVNCTTVQNLSESIKKNMNLFNPEIVQKCILLKATYKRTSCNRCVTISIHGRKMINVLTHLHATETKTHTQVLDCWYTIIYQKSLNSFHPEIVQKCILWKAPFKRTSYHERVKISVLYHGTKSITLKISVT